MAQNWGKKSKHFKCDDDYEEPQTREAGVSQGKLYGDGDYGKVLPLALRSSYKSADKAEEYTLPVSAWDQTQPNTQLEVIRGSTDTLNKGNEGEVVNDDTEYEPVSCKGVKKPGDDYEAPVSGGTSPTKYKPGSCNKTHDDQNFYDLDNTSKCDNDDYMLPITQNKLDQMPAYTM